MSLLWTDGFDLYGTADSAIETSMTARGYVIGTSISLDDDTGRLSGKSLKYTSASNPISCVLGNTDSKLACGIGFKTNDITPTNNTTGSIISFYNGTDEIKLQLTPTSYLTINVGGTTLATSTNTISDNTWQYIEWEFEVGSNAAYTVKVDGDVWLSGNGDTQAGSVTYYSDFKLHPTTSYASNDIWLDDLYICNGAGSTNNGLLGDSKIVTIQPDGDDSCNFATLSTGTDHYALVDDDPLDEDSTYVEDDTTGNRDVLTYENISTINTIFGICIITTARRTDTDAINVKSVIDSNGTIETGTSHALNSSYSADNTISEEDPDTSSAWTQTTINAAKFGYEVA